MCSSRYVFFVLLMYASCLVVVICEEEDVISRKQIQDDDLKLPTLFGPLQLNETRYAACYADVAPKPDLSFIQKKYNLDIVDGLIVWLAVYSGDRFEIWNINSTIQQPAFERWDKPYWPQEEALANALVKRVSVLNSSGVVTPNQVFKDAYQVCGGNDSNDIFCTFLLCHNTLRLLGRYSTYVNSAGANFLPDWWQQNATYWQDFSSTLQSHLIELRVPGTEGASERYGDWYHSMGIDLWSTHQAVLQGAGKGLPESELAVLMEVLLNPIIAGHWEDPIKATIDMQSTRLTFDYLFSSSSLTPLYCNEQQGYVLSNNSTL